MFRGPEAIGPAGPRKNNLTKRIMVLVACCVALSTAAIGSIAYMNIRSEADQLAQANLRAEAQLLSQRFYRDYHLMAKDLETVAQTPPIQGIIRSLQNNGVDPQDGSTIDLWNTRLATIFQAVLRGNDNYFQFRYIGMADNGRELVRVNHTDAGMLVTPDERLQQKSNEPYFQQAMAAPAGKATFTEVTYNRERGKEDGTQTPTLRGIYPVDAEDGTRFGFLIININYEKMLQASFREISPDRHTFVVNDSGDYMEHSAEAGQISHRLELHGHQTRPLPDILKNVVRSTRDGLFETEETVGYFVRQNSEFDQASANLGVVVAVSQDQYHAVANRHGLQFLLVGLALIGISTIFATVAARRMMLPLGALTNAVRSSDPDDRFDKLPTDRNDEIGELAEAIQSRNVSLVESRQRASVIMNNIVDGLILTNGMDEIVEFNPSCERMFGYKAREIIGSKVSKLMTAEAADELARYLKKCREGNVGEPTNRLRELEAVDTWGRVFPIELAINVVRVNGEPYYSSVIRDISERKEVERLRSEFVSTVSHELRTPLTSIRGSLSLVETLAPENLPPKVQQLVSMAQKNTERLIALVNDILDFEKLRFNKAKFDFNKIDLNEEVRRAVELTQGVADDAGIGLKTDLVSDELLVDLDASRFQQVLSNLISNAVKFSSNEGQVVIRTAVSGKCARLEVEDRGEGIPDSFKPRIFEPFSQADGSVTRSQNGTGLGLNIAKRIVEGMHGEIGFSSLVGQGTVFWVEFPLQSQAVLPVDKPSFKPSTNRVRALHVEDDRDFHFVLATGMDGDLDLVHAETLAQARALLESDTFDLVILDRMIKDGEGLDLIKDIRNLENTKIVVVTAKDENVHHINVDDILIKTRTRPGEFVNRFAAIVDEIKEKKRCA
jgi:PAS domain S-box-containing protein